MSESSALTGNPRYDLLAAPGIRTHVRFISADFWQGNKVGLYSSSPGVATGSGQESCVLGRGSSIFKRGQNGIVFPAFFFFPHQTCLDSFDSLPFVDVGMESVNEGRGGGGLFPAGRI